ncbi:MAG: laccase [Frankiales bacterium]|nr:laccase [Frankiales bacterium]
MPLPLLEAGLPGAWFTTRQGGVSDGPWEALNLALHVDDDANRVLANRALLQRAVGADALVFAQQVHGDGVAVVTDPRADAVPGVDALVTTTAGLGLVVMAADCLPVLLVDRTAGVAGAAHAGRQGLLAGVLERTVEAMVARGAEPGRTAARVGPAAGACCYEVPAAMADDAEARLPGTRGTTRQGTPSVDLLAGARAVLAGCGLADVDAVDRCTVHDDAFFSYRRSGTTGRHAGVVVL